MSILALLFLVIIIISLKKNSMSIKSSVAWLLLPIAFILIAIFPEPIKIFANWLGFETLSNFIFFAIIALLIIICFSHTLVISRQQSQITKLVQEISILKAKNKKK